MLYRRKPSVVTATQLTVDNLESLELLSGGSIKGTKLPPEKRELELIVDDEEVRARVGDYVINDHDNNRWIVCSKKHFDRDYERA